jgi:hypothetical protein
MCVISVKKSLNSTDDVLKANIDYSKGPPEEDSNSIHNRPRDWVEFKIKELATYKPLHQ